MNIELLRKLLIIAITVSTISCLFIQKTKVYFKSSKFLSLYSFLINMILGLLFCLTFTKIKILTSLWVGFFAFVDADTIYKTLEGKLKSYQELKKEKITIIERDD